MKGKSLWTRMVLHGFLVTGFFILACGIGLIFYNSSILREGILTRLESQSGWITKTSEPLLVAQDMERVREVMELIGLSDNILIATIYFPDGRVLAHQGSALAKPDFSKPRELKREIRETADGFMELSQPILHDGILLGWLYLKRDLLEIRDQRRLHLGILFVILAGFLILNLISTTWFYRGIVKSLHELVGAANRVSLEKDYSLRVTKAAGDEFGELTDAFNLMLEKVQRRDLELQSSERRLYQVIDLVPHMIFAKDRQGRYLLCNRKVADAYGTTIPQILESNHMQMHTMDDHEARQMLEDDHRVMDAREPLQVEETFTGPDGLLRILRTTKIPFTQSGTTEDAILGIAMDITREKEAERELREAHAELQKANDELEQRVEERTAEISGYQQRLIRQEKLAAIGQVSGSIAHELRNPLGAMKQSIFFLRRYLAKIGEGDRHPKLGEHLDIMDTELSAADHVITSLLDMTRVRKMERTAVELEQILEEVKSRCSIVSPMTLELDLEPQPFLLQADPLQLRQVLVNLVHNARDACEEDGLVRIKARRDEASRICCIEVSDSGCGIDDEHQGQIFEPLYTTKARGTGLGLSICRQIVEEYHGGRIQVESKVGAGTRIIIKIPFDRGFSSP